MEVVNIGSRRFTQVIATDEPGPGGACHNYDICNIPTEINEPTVVFTRVKFQHGPIQENGVNGCHNEDLLAVVLHRLKGFQSGDFSCCENALAITNLEEALHWLNHRTADRQNRGVEGTSEK